jgi:multidrug efflux system membrane fusion protein
MTDSFRTLAVVLNCAVVFAAATPPAAADVTADAVTAPSKDVTLSFVRPGKIAEVLVKEGETVKAGQLLVRLDDAAERAQLAQLKAQADDDTRVKAAEAQLQQKVVDLKKIEAAEKRGAATEIEVEHARLDVTIGRLSVDLAKFQKAQDRLKYEEARLQLERMQLKSPVAGTVERIVVEAGESVDALQQVMRIVDIDPLHVVVPVPRKAARRITKGDAADVAFEGERASRRGRVEFVAQVADAASETLMVRVVVPNGQKRPAGERVRVSFPEKSENSARPAGGNERQG